MLATCQMKMEEQLGTKWSNVSSGLLPSPRSWGWKRVFSKMKTPKNALECDPIRQSEGFIFDLTSIVWCTGFHQTLLRVFNSFWRLLCSSNYYSATSTTCTPHSCKKLKMQKLEHLFFIFNRLTSISDHSASGSRVLDWAVARLVYQRSICALNSHRGKITWRPDIWVRRACSSMWDMVGMLLTFIST